MLSLLLRVPVLDMLLRADSEVEATTLTALLVASCASEFFSGCFEAACSYGMAVRIRTLLQSAIFNKMMLMSPTALSRNSAGYLVSLVGVDCVIISTAATVVARVGFALLFTPFMFYALWRRAGTIPVLCCVAWQLFVFLLFIPAMKLQQKMWARVIKCRDTRLRKITDILSSVRLVKFYAWEQTFVQSLSQLRRPEMKHMFAVNLTDGLLDSLFVSTSSVMAVILFGTWALCYPEKALTASLSFSCIYALSLLDPACGNIVVMLRMIVLSVYAVKRITKACTEPERREAESLSEESVQPEGSVCLEDCCFTWSSAEARHRTRGEAVLRDVNLKVEPGSLVGLVGSVGSGKSSLISAIQGDVHQTKGRCRVTGSIACVPQSACIYNMSIRDNILFGRRFDVSLYERVLSACELLKDIAGFPAGDLTEVGQKGATLSGGQKQRIALARAVYSDSSVYLLDDTLSALDVHVASKVFDRVIGRHGMLRKKTRLIVCTQTQYLEQMDMILLVADRQITPFETVKQLMNDSRCPKMICSGDKIKDRRTDGKDTEMPQNNEKKGLVHRVTEDEVETSNLGNTDLLLSIVRMCGPSLALCCSSFLLRACAVGAYLVWMKQWTDASITQWSTSVWVGGLTAICICDVLFGCLGAFTLAVSQRNLSNRLYKAMIRSVLGCPVVFFDATPRGRVLNRLSTELDAIDSRLFIGCKQLLQSLTAGIARIIVTGLQVPTAAVLAALAVTFYLFAMVILAKASNMARRFESVHVARLLQHVAETRDTLSVIRSYGVEDRFGAHCYRLVDAAMTALQTLVDCLRCCRFLGGLCGFVVILASVVFAILPPGRIQNVAADGSSVGLVLSSSMGVSLLVMASTGAVFFFVQTLVSFEKCLEYTRLPQEVDDDESESITDNARTIAKGCDSYQIIGIRPLHDTTWPSEGKLEFDHYSASYKPGILPDVLTNLSFVAHPREKVGVVGRTGAGKSSLLMAVLRVLKASAGCIRIDNVDITTVSLRRLRSVVTIIPQDPYLTKGPLRDVLDPTGSHSDSDVWCALGQAHLTEFVSRHSMNLRMDVGDGGSNLSAGQRQLVCLARALLRRPRVLLMDEATSHMDGDTDRIVQATLRQSFAYCTVLTIAHRLETILDYDKILVMSKGRVVEYGSTQKLASNRNSALHTMLRQAGLLPKDHSRACGDLPCHKTRL
ncbi:ATP-binding cassette sub-family C member 3-like [Dermacentor albipictus]|uniref:ATP-binding cassette sub-family C member 3-like n=1 Tax=Dermacentor albipictus TaxID=60249 RepID=UPI0038FCBAD7